MTAAMPPKKPARRGRPKKDVRPPPRQRELQPLRPLLPARPAFAEPSTPPNRTGTCFYDLPPELRIAIYKLALKRVVVRIDQPSNRDKKSNQLALVSKQIYAEVRPIMHRFCRVEAAVIDFDFRHVQAWLTKLRSNNGGDADLSLNKRLRLQLSFTDKPKIDGKVLRHWLHERSDPYRTQVPWTYNKPKPLLRSSAQTCLRRRYERMKDGPQRDVMRAMVTRAGLPLKGEAGKAEWKLAMEEAQEQKREDALEEGRLLWDDGGSSTGEETSTSDEEDEEDENDEEDEHDEEDEGDEEDEDV